MVHKQYRFVSIASCVLTAILAAVVALVLPRVAAADEASVPKMSVKLVIDYGDGVQKHFTQIAHKAGMTVWNALQIAEKHPRGIQVKSRGKEDTLLVMEIDGQANEGGTSSRNWIFRVDGELGEQSAGITPVEAGDVIEWRYERFAE